MEGISIYAPWRVTAARAIRQRNEQREPNRHTETPSDGGRLAETRARAALAVEHTATLQRAAEARARCGSWQPGAAASFADYCALATAEDLLVETRRQQVCGNCGMRGYLNDAGTLCLYCAASTTADRHDRNPGPRRVELRTEAPPPGLRIEHSAAVGRIVDVR